MYIKGKVISNSIHYIVEVELFDGLGSIRATGASPKLAMVNFMAMLSELRVNYVKATFVHGDWEYAFNLQPDGNVYSDGVTNVNLTTDTLVYERGQ